MRGKAGNLNNLDELFNLGKDFELSKEEIEKQTNGILSSNLSYLKNNSALAKKAKANGYYLEIEPIEIKPMKIRFRKKR